MLKNTTSIDTFIGKPIEVDDETSDEQKEEHKVKFNESVRCTNARIKRQLEKKWRKRNMSQAHSKSQVANPSKPPWHNLANKGSMSNKVIRIKILFILYD